MSTFFDVDAVERAEGIFDTAATQCPQLIPETLSSSFSIDSSVLCMIPLVGMSPESFYHTPIPYVKWDRSGGDRSSSHKDAAESPD